MDKYYYTISTIVPMDKYYYTTIPGMRNGKYGFFPFMLLNVLTSFKRCIIMPRYSIGLAGYESWKMEENYYESL